jgi:hypothetical protein
MAQQTQHANRANVDHSHLPLRHFHNLISTRVGRLRDGRCM